MTPEALAMVEAFCWSSDRSTRAAATARLLADREQTTDQKDT